MVQRASVTGLVVSATRLSHAVLALHVPATEPASGEEVKWLPLPLGRNEITTTTHVAIHQALRIQHPLKPRASAVVGGITAPQGHRRTGQSAYHHEGLQPVNDPPVFGIDIAPLAASQLSGA